VRCWRHGGRRGSTTSSARGDDPLKGNLIVLGTTLALLAALLLGVELVIRHAMPNVADQGVDHRLYREHAYGASWGWTPNATGRCFGKRVRIDADGFVQTPHPDHTAVSWMLIGDSVCFGVGVDPLQAFPALLQRALPDIRLWNTAAIGYGVRNYADVEPVVMRRDSTIRRVVMFWCLNDVYISDIRDEIGHIDLPLFAWLRRHSKTYLVLKNLLSDRSRVYFLHDQALYRRNGADLDTTLATLAAIHRDVAERGAALTVVMLPYEYQLRLRDSREFLPQQLLSEGCRRLGIDCVDLAPALLAHPGRARDLYLFADGIHFSPLGHRVVFEALGRTLDLPSGGVTH